jgi:hypothetical protein
MIRGLVEHHPKRLDDIHLIISPGIVVLKFLTVHIVADA